MDNAAVPFSEVKARASIQRRRLPLSRKSLLKFPSGLIPIYLQAQQKWIGLRIKRPTSHIQQSIQNIISYMHNIRLLKLVCLAAAVNTTSLTREISMFKTLCRLRGGSMDIRRMPGQPWFVSH
ncbi:hypothetical protein LMH87_007399 [Akanthomyces muscarius]|uniref:Uncharacterized protein n=1 Tax=Akanthomyces muscarius TaxID=2231603 RepID=A0A9W8QT07_AKAMU|nr:hypothetical protein LMH87_007399 [Akanthomyces muscarius]KAJ4165782.1 hypothetical protein LMH87_007399 [Akanthomyces muscarius]